MCQPSKRYRSTTPLNGDVCILRFSEYIIGVDIWGQLEQTDTVMGEKTGDEPQSLFMNLCTQQILLL